jgi:hypothetical protein
MTTYRFANLTPWYHQTRPRCEAVTLMDEQQCLFSARYEGSRTGKGKGVRLCKTHADMADFPTKLMERKRITVREDY